MRYSGGEKKITIKNMILNLFPWRDGLGIVLSGTPFRFGEIFAGLSGIILTFKHKKKIRLTEIGIIVILLINLINAIVGIVAYNEFIEIGFALKYLVRNVVYLFFVVGFLQSPICAFCAG